MEALTRPDVILTHESDLDGFVAGHLLQRLARKRFDTDVRLEAWNTQAWRQRPLKETTAWVCDLGCDARVDRPGWLVIDHHPLEVRPVQARLIHDATKSAALLCYELCQSQGLGSPELDRLVTFTDVGDVFREEHPMFEEAIEYGALVKMYSFWNLSRLLDGRIEGLLDHPLLEVVRTRRRIEDPIGLAWSRDRVVDLGGGVGWVDVTVGNANLIVHDLLSNGGCNYSVLVTLVKKASTGVVASFRSRDGKALEVARRLQGGGHPNAAGATLPRGIQRIADAVEYLRGVLDPRPPALTSLEAAFTDLRLPR